MLIGLTPKALVYICINHGDQIFFLILKHHKRLSQVFLINLNTYVMGQRRLEIFLLLQRGDRRRQILTSKVDPQTTETKGFFILKSS